MMGITTNLRGLVTPWLWANWKNSVALRERPARDDGGHISASLTIAMDIIPTASISASFVVKLKWRRSAR